MFPASPTDSSSFNSPDREPYDPLRNCESPPAFYEDEYDSDGSHRSSASGSSRGSRVQPKRPPPPKNTKHLFPKTEFVEELRPEELRWFYRDEQNKNWKPFIGYDSLRIECKYRELRHRDSHINEDNIELIVVRGGLYEVDVVSRKCFAIYWTADSIDIMRGTWFYHGTWQPMDEAYARQIETEHLAKFRGQRLSQEPAIGVVKEKSIVHNMKFKEFHVDWNSPMEVYVFSESTSSRVYRSVRQTFGMQKSGTRLERGYAYESRMDDKPSDISHLVFVVHGIGQKMDTGRIVRCCSDLRNTVTRIKSKLFSDDASEERAEFLPVEWRSSLKLDGDIVDSITPQKVKGLRHLLNSSAMDILYYTSPLYRSEITHGLQSQLNKLYSRFVLRHPMFEAGGGKVSVIGHSLGKEITHGLQTELNRLYGMFCVRHPYFEANGGKVSIVAHSLGCVITYDIITGWNPIELYDQYVATAIEEVSHAVEGASNLVASLERKRKEVHDLEMTLLAMTERQHIKTPTLKFKLENFFCLGSPLAVFLALRGVRPQATGQADHIMPRALCKRMFNIYHPADPVAYRLEPLVLKHYTTIMPLRIHRYDLVSSATPYSAMKSEAYSALKTGSDKHESKNEPPQKSVDEDQSVYQDVTDSPTSSSQGGGIVGSLWSKLGGRKKDKTEELSAELKAIKRVQHAMKQAEEEMERRENEKQEMKLREEIEQTAGIHLEYRLDYSLREGSMENSYVAAITSHTSYWSNNDVAMFVLSHLTPAMNQSKNCNSTVTESVIN